MSNKQDSWLAWYNSKCLPFETKSVSALDKFCLIVCCSYQLFIPLLIILKRSGDLFDPKRYYLFPIALSVGVCLFFFVQTRAQEGQYFHCLGIIMLTIGMIVFVTVTAMLIIATTLTILMTSAFIFCIGLAVTTGAAYSTNPHLGTSWILICTYSAAFLTNTSFYCGYRRSRIIRVVYFAFDLMLLTLLFIPLWLLSLVHMVLEHLQTVLLFDHGQEVMDRIKQNIRHRDPELNRENSRISYMPLAAGQARRMSGQTARTGRPNAT